MGCSKPKPKPKPRPRPGKSLRKAMIAEIADFLLWTRQKPRAFVVFPKSDLLALRAISKE